MGADRNGEPPVHDNLENVQPDTTKIGDALNNLVEKWRQADKFTRSKVLIIGGYVLISLVILAFVIFGGGQNQSMSATSWLQTLEDTYYVSVENLTRSTWRDVELVLNRDYVLRLEELSPGASFSTQVTNFKKRGCKEEPTKKKKKKRRRSRRRRKRYSKNRGIQSKCAAPPGMAPSTLKVIHRDGVLEWVFGDLN